MNFSNGLFELILFGYASEILNQKSQPVCEWICNGAEKICLILAEQIPEK
jgi:hypothetical protein